MKKRNSVLACVLAAALMLSFAACTKTPASSAGSAEVSSTAATSSAEEKTYYNKTGMPICDTQITVTVSGKEAYGPMKGKLAIDAVAEQTGIYLDCTSYASDAWDSQFSLMMANNKLPDLLVAAFLNRSDVNTWGEQGYFADLLKYADLMPNMMAYRDREVNAAAYETATGGEVYGITATRTSDRSCINDATFISNAWLKAVGKEMPTTTDELLEVLRAFKAQDANENGDPNDEIPASMNDSSGFRLNWVLRAAYGIYSTNADFLVQSDKNDQIYLAETTDAYKDWLKLMRTMYQEELMDNSCFVQTDDEFMQKTKNNQVGLWTSWNSLNGTTGRSDAAVFTDYSMFAGVKSDYVDEIIFPIYIKAAEGARTLINAKSEYQEALARLIDYVCYTTEGYTLWTYGKENVNFEYIDDGRGNMVANADKFADLNAYTSVVLWRNNVVAVNTNAGGCAPTVADAVYKKATDAELQEMVEKNDATYGNGAYMELFVRNNKVQECFPFLVLSADETEQIGTRQSDMAEYIKTARVNFINGTTDIDAGWAEFQNQLKTMGADEVIKIQQAAYDRYIGK